MELAFRNEVVNQLAEAYHLQYRQDEKVVKALMHGDGSM